MTPLLLHIESYFFSRFSIYFIFMPFIFFVLFIFRSDRMANNIFPVQEFQLSLCVNFLFNPQNRLLPPRDQQLTITATSVPPSKLCFFYNHQFPEVLSQWNASRFWHCDFPPWHIMSRHSTRPVFLLLFHSLAMYSSLH